MESGSLIININSQEKLIFFFKVASKETLVPALVLGDCGIERWGREGIGHIESLFLPVATPMAGCISR